MSTTTVPELQRTCGDRVDGLMDEIDTMGPDAARALRAIDRDCP